MVDGEVTLLEDRRQLKLVGSHLVVARLAGDGQLECLDLQILHKGLYTVRDGAEIMVVHLLVLGTLVAHQRTTRHQQVGTGGIKSFVNEEIFLFPTQVDLYLAYIVVEEIADLLGGLGDSMDGAQQRCLPHLYRK